MIPGESARRWILDGLLEKKRDCSALHYLANTLSAFYEAWSLAMSQKTTAGGQTLNLVTIYERI
jgi:hypothetical protein